MQNLSITSPPTAGSLAYPNRMSCATKRGAGGGGEKETARGDKLRALGGGWAGSGGRRPKDGAQGMWYHQWRDGHLASTRAPRARILQTINKVRVLFVYLRNSYTVLTKGY